MDSEIFEDEQTIYTDYDRTKWQIWEAYEGVAHHYAHWLMKKKLGRNTRDNRAGLFKYCILFVYSIKGLMLKKSFKEKFDKEVLEEISLLINKITKEEDFTEKDFHLIRDFSEDFMFYSGIKDVITSAANPGRSMVH